MGVFYFTLLFVVSAINLAVLVVRFRKQQNNYMFYVFFTIVIAIFGHLLLSLSTSVEGAILANKVNYLGATFIPMFMFFALLQVCRIRISSFSRGFLVILAFFILALALSVGYVPYYYTSVQFVSHNGVGDYVATYGWGHSIFNVMMGSYVIASFSVIVFTAFRRKVVSVKNIVAMALTEAISITSFFVARAMQNDTMVMPLVYVCDQFLLLYICSNVKWYDISSSIGESLEEDNHCAYVLFSSTRRYLGCNNIALNFFPELAKFRVDSLLDQNAEFTIAVNGAFESLDKSNEVVTFSIEQEDRHFTCSARGLPQKFNKKLYLFKIEDDSQVQIYIKALDKNLVYLKKTLAENINMLQTMAKRMALGMAKMAESRDDNTGGHMKRTSEVVKILVDEMRKDESLGLSQEFFEDVVAAAPMHDLGKITIEDRVLRKPGRFTDEEFNVMKKHPKEGAAIVENLLTGIENPYFVKIAKNVAYYHHERWDGRGYPNGLAGENIPIEARIMAVADVFDALVSRRCYKERMSFGDAYGIIVGGMGQQFDPSLEKYFVCCFDLLKKYYIAVEH